jgi:ribosomal protein L37AE/L43A
VKRGAQPAKTKSTKPIATTKATGKLPSSKADATPKTKRAMALLASSRSSNADFDEFGEPIEFDKNMSILPEPEVSEREKRLQHISRPRTGGASKEKPLDEEPEVDENDEIEDYPITVKPSSSPPRQSFSSKSVQSIDESSPQRIQSSVRGSLTLLKTKTRRRRSIAEIDQTEPETIDDDSNVQIAPQINTIPLARNQIYSKVESTKSESAESKRRNTNCIRKAGCQCSDCLALANVSLQQPIPSVSYNDNIDEDSSNTALYECGDCGRKFNANAYEKHTKICKKIFVNSRKQFDMTKQRIQDDEQLRILQDTKKQKEIKNKTNEKSAKWKNQSQAFREAMKAARDVSHAISTGAPLPPPTISAPDPSLIPCPHCGRRFNEKAAERHIPLCTSIKAKPTKLNKGGGISASAGVSLKDKKKHSTW